MGQRETEIRLKETQVEPSKERWEKKFSLTDEIICDSGFIRVTPIRIKRKREQRNDASNQRVVQIHFAFVLVTARNEVGAR